MTAPTVIGLGGSGREGSLSLAALTRALSVAEAYGANTELLDIRDLPLPPYAPGKLDRDDPRLATLFGAITRADAVLVASPVYQESISGSLKNVLDYLHDLESGPQALRNKRVGLIAVSAGSGTAACLSAMHIICTALGAAMSRIRIGIHEGILDSNAVIFDPIPDERLEAMVLDVLNGHADGIRFEESA